MIEKVFYIMKLNSEVSSQKIDLNLNKYNLLN